MRGITERTPRVTGGEPPQLMNFLTEGQQYGSVSIFLSVILTFFTPLASTPSAFQELHDVAVRSPVHDHSSLSASLYALKLIMLQPPLFGSWFASYIPLTSKLFRWIGDEKITSPPVERPSPSWKLKCPSTGAPLRPMPSATVMVLSGTCVSTQLAQRMVATKPLSSAVDHTPAVQADRVAVFSHSK